MEKGGLIGIALYFAMIYGVFYFASKGWAKGK